MKKLTHLFTITTILVGLLAAVPATPALAGACDGTPGNDPINCTLADTDNTVNGDLGDDTITVASDVLAGVVKGDGTTAGGFNSGTGGNDIITVNNNSDVVIGDFTDGAGGDDIITINGTVVTVQGDNATSGGADQITINGSVTTNVFGDITSGAGGNDLIVVAAGGSVGGNVTGDNDGSGSGGNDTIIINGAVGTDALHKDVFGDKVDSDPGDDIITVGTTGTVTGFIYGDNSTADGNGNDTITVNGYAAAVSGDSYDGNGSGNDTITNNSTVAGSIFGDSFSGVGSGNDTITNNGLVLTIMGDSNTGDGTGADVITNNGTVIFIYGDSATVTGSGADSITNNGTVSFIFGDTQEGIGSGGDTITNNGTVMGNIYGDSFSANGFGNDIITNNGTVADIFGDTAANPGAGIDVITLGSTSTTANVFAGGGDDTVIVQSNQTATVSYSTVCGDISVGSLGLSAVQGATVTGLLDGGSGAGDTFVVSYTGYEAPSVTYNTANFESFVNSSTILALPGVSGPARLYDDGVVLAFAANNGIDVCSGPNGFRAGTIDFAKLDAGQTTFAAGNAGWFVNVVALGGGKYQAKMFDGNGVLQSDKFTFVR